ncbi:TetR/AcrR family transcriptional regulator [Gordonia sp. FQ]|uniref:TetR/AcrR family transcriptional regulator n=1 Tax=Gordonia sp. FQ TaxID=3446634 RepID=UPI003F868769
MTARQARTRPANRRELIVTAATRLFVDDGYAAVSMARIAGAVGVQPSALYRHFTNKQSVLCEVFAEYVRTLCAALDDPGPAGPLRALAERILADRFAGRLWIREYRHLPRATADEIRETLLTRLDAVVAPGCPGPSARVCSTAVLGVLFSVATHHAEITDPAALVSLAERAAAGPPEVPPAAPRPAGLTRVGNRELILATAGDLFADRTYEGVGIDDIAEAVGVAPSSIYNHFSGKAELLAVLLHRGNGYLQVTLDDVLRNSADASAALTAVVSSYAGFAVRHPGLVQVIVAESGALEAPDAALLRSAQRDYVGEWVRLYSGDPAESRVTVIAAITAINDVARLPEISRCERGERFVAGYGRRILALP